MSRKRYKQGALQGRPEWWLPVGWLQFGFLYDAGLKPYHTVLDIGCGTFRVGRLLIDYLDARRYYGIDRYPEALQVGVERVLEPSGLLSKRPHLIEMELSDEWIPFDALNCSFDYVWVHSVFVHTGPSVARSTIRQLSPMLSANGRIFATAFISSDLEPVEWGTDGTHIVTNPDKEFWHYAEDFFQDVADQSGLSLDVMDYAHPHQMKMMEFSRE